MSHMSETAILTDPAGNGECRLLIINLIVIIIVLSGYGVDAKSSAQILKSQSDKTFKKRGRREIYVLSMSGFYCIIGRRNV